MDSFNGGINKVAAGSSAYGAQAPRLGTEAVRVLELDTISHTINETNIALQDVLVGFRSHIDSLVGCAPMGDGKQANTPDMSRLQGLARSTGTTRELVEYLRNELDRLRGI